MDQILLIQHCQSQHHVDRARQFPDYDNGLTEFGRRQARALAGRLSASAFAGHIQLYTSDMARAAETAAIIGQALGRTPLVQSELREWSDPHTLERRERPLWTGPDPHGNLFDCRPYAEHETWREFLARVSGFMDRLICQSSAGALPVLVVHGGTLSNIVVWWLRIPLDVLPERTCFAASPGSLSMLTRNKYGNPVLERLNDRAHLEGLENPG